MLVVVAVFWWIFVLYVDGNDYTEQTSKEKKLFKETKLHVHSLKEISSNKTLNTIN